MKYIYIYIYTILRRFVNTRLPRRRLSASLYVVYRALVLYWPPTRNRKTRGTAGLRVAVILVWLLGTALIYEKNNCACNNKPRTLILQKYTITDRHS